MKMICKGKVAGEQAPQIFLMQILLTVPAFKLPFRHVTLSCKGPIDPELHPSDCQAKLNTVVEHETV